MAKPTISLTEAIEKISALLPEMSEREACRSVCGEFAVMFKTYGGFDKEYTAGSLRRKFIEHKMGRLKNSPFENRPVEDAIKEDLINLRQKAREKELKAKYDALLRINEELQARYDAALQITDRVIDIPAIITSDKNKKEQATAIVTFSDWHVEERVDAKTINGINEYNPKIAKRRAEAVVANSVKLINKERNHSDIDTLVLWLGGDFITGYIHPELEESNYMTPIEAIMYAKDLLRSALRYYQEQGFKKIIVPCNVGNHGRTMQKPRVSTGNKNSYEFMMYHDLKNEFKDMEFVIPDGMYVYLDIYDRPFRFFHGDHVKFGGGIGGLTVPLTKSIMRADTQRKAYYNIMGHYHQFWEATSNCLVNGSLIGYGAYAQRIGATPEPPMQGLRIMDKKRGLTAKFPIFCD